LVPRQAGFCCEYSRAVFMLDTKEQTNSEQYVVLAAQITGAHGVTGNVRVRLIGDNPVVTAQSLTQSKTVRCVPIGGEGEARELTLLSLRKQTQPKGAWIAQFKELKHRNDAEALLGGSIYITEAQRAKLSDGEYYVDQLLGIAMVTDTGHDLGLLTDVLNSPANDVYVTDKDILVPAVSAFIIGIDLDARQILVRDVPGLREGGAS